MDKKCPKCGLENAIWSHVENCSEGFVISSCPTCSELRAEVADLKEVLADKRRLTRDLDVAMHGEKDAAKQASLCDLIEPAKRLRAERDLYKEGFDQQLILKEGMSEANDAVREENKELRAQLSAAQGDWFPPHKCGLFLTHNEHKDYYETVAKRIKDRCIDNSAWLSEEEKQRAIETDEVWEFQWYPDTPIGSYIIVASSLDAIKAALRKRSGYKGE